MRPPTGAPPGWSLILAAMLLVLRGAPGLTPALRFEPALGVAEPWRWLTGHLVHLSWGHAGLNAATVVLFAVVLPPLERARLGLAAAGAAVLGVNVGILALRPELPWYVGFSGAAYGVIAAGSARWAAEGSRYGMLACVLLASKLGIDALLGPAGWSEALVGGKVMTLAHLLGALPGAAVGLVLSGESPATVARPRG